eukprot:TRINITY_DN6328_c0_g1_i2.p1 TRINITY_DN6328_c0_g1~~TRINITY_DN6328_c0_g1_i2.p1  ORF type:complete len:214 (+),score=27.83 TRINITY_DN6328_c0_g1_i2:27-644(+)
MPAATAAAPVLPSMSGTQEEKVLWHERVHKEEKAAVNYLLGEMGLRNTAEQHRAARAKGALAADPWADNDKINPLSSQYPFFTNVQLRPLTPLETPAWRLGRQVSSPGLCTSVGDEQDEVATQRGVTPLETPPRRVMPGTGLSRRSGRQSSKASSSSNVRRCSSAASLRQQVAQTVQEEMARVTSAPRHSSKRERLTAMLSKAKG